MLTSWQKSQFIRLGKRWEKEKKLADSISPAAAALIASLPELFGTDKQIEWAKKIRVECVIKDAPPPGLRHQTSAEWWIENRKSLLK